MDESMSQTRSLLERWHQGDSKALNQLLEEELEWVRSRVRARLGQLLRRKGDTDDYVQLAMLHVLKYGPRFLVSDRQHFRALLARIVENVLCDESDRYTAKRRAAERERALPADSVLNLDSPAKSITRPSQVAERHEREAWVRMGLELLDPEDREVIRLREFDGLSFADIGARLGVAEDSARMRFNRAVPRLAMKVQALKSGDLPAALGE